MNILLIFLGLFFTYLLINDIGQRIITIYYLGFLPHKWFITLIDEKTIRIHHNGLKTAHCIDEGDEIIDMQEEFKVNKLITLYLRLP